MSRITKSGKVDGRYHGGMRPEVREARAESMRQRAQHVKLLTEALKDIRAVAAFRIEHGEDTIGMRSIRERAEQALS